MTSEKSYDNAQRISQLRADVGGLILNASDLTDTGSLTSNWGKGTGFFKWSLVTPNLLFVAAKDLNITPGTSTVADGTTILTAANAGWPHPASNKILAAYCDSLKVSGSSFETAALKFVNDGSVQCLGISTAATTLSCYGFVLLSV